MKTVVALVALFGAMTSCFADTATAFADGKTWGKDKKTSSFNDFQKKADSQTVPGYGSNATTQRGYYGGGKGQLFGFGASKITTCASGPASADNFTRQDCEAVNFVAKQPQQRPTYTINKNDPLIKKATSIAADPNTTLDNLGWNPTKEGSGYSACTNTTTQTSPAKYTTEVCNEYATPETKSCTIGQVVHLDEDANFQCNRTLNAYERKTCNKVAVVSVESGLGGGSGTGQCTRIPKAAGTYLGNGGADCSTLKIYANGTTNSVSFVHDLGRNGYLSGTLQINPVGDYRFPKIQGVGCEMGETGYYSWNEGGPLYLDIWLEEYGGTAVVNVNIQPPYDCQSKKVTVSWDNQCSTLESQAQ